MGPFMWPKLFFIASLCLVSFLFGQGWGEQIGYREAEAAQEHNAFMRDVGICEWSQAVAEQVQCSGALQ